MPALPTDILAKVLEALRTHRNARRAAKLVGVSQATAWRTAKKHGIALISLAEHMKARRSDPAFNAKQASAVREVARRWLKAQHAKPKFHKKSIEAARLNLTRLNLDPAFRQASSERLKRLHEDPAFGAKLDAARRAARKLRKAEFREKAIEAALRTLTRLDDDPAFRLAASERLNRLLHANPALRAKEAAAPRPARNRGFAIAPILYLLGLIGVGAGVLFSGYSQILRSNQTMSNTLAAKNDLQGTATTLAASSWLSTDQTLLCPPIVGSNSPSAPSIKCSSSVSAITIGLAFGSAVAGNLPNSYASASTTGTPVEVGVFAAGSGARVLDPWGHYYVYCRWENSIGTANALMVITAGANGKLETKCGDTTAQGDDMFVVWTTAVTQNRAAVWQTVTSGTAVTGTQFGATGTQINIDTAGNVSIPGTLGVTGAATVGTAGLSVTGTTTLAGLSASTGTFTGALSGTNGTFSGNLSATGTTTLGPLSAGSSTLSSLAVTNNGTVGGTLGVTGASTLGPLTAGSSTLSGLSVTGTTYLGGNATTSNGVVQIGTSVSASGTSSPLLTVGKAVSNVYPLTIDQYGNVTGGAFTGTTFTGNLVGSQSGGSVSATTLAASGATTLNNTLAVTGATTLSAALNGTSAIFSGNVQAASFTGTMSFGGGGVTISGVVPIANGGTGQTSAGNALSALFSGAGTIAQMIPGADLVNNSVTSTQLSTTGVTAGTYTSVTVGADGRVTAGTGSGGLVSSINDGSGDSVSVGTSSGITYSIGSSTLGNWTSTGLMVGSSKAALDTLDVYGGTAIGTSYAGTTAAPTNGLIVQGNAGFGTTSPTARLNVGTNYALLDSNEVAQFGTTTNGASNYVTVRGKATSGPPQHPNSYYAAVKLGAIGSASTSVLFLDTASSGVASDGTPLTAPATQLSLRVAGTEIMNLNSGGNVGIGTAAPMNLLDVNGNADVQGSLSVGKLSAMTYSTANATAAVLGQALGTTGLIYGGFFQSASSSTASTAVYGNGSSSSGSTYGGYFTDASSSGVSLYALAGAAATIPLVAQGAASQTGDLTEWQNSSGSVLAEVNASGKVGIGTATPLDTLDVYGTGIHIGSGVPSSTTYALYNNGGTLTWNGTALSGGGSTFAAGTVGAPGLAVTGDTATGLWAPATSTLSITAGGAEAARFLQGSGTVVNYLTLAGAATGASPILGAAGSDTDVGITITPKGAGNLTLTSGRLLFGSNNAVALPNSGHSTIVGASAAATVTSANLYNAAMGYQALNALTTGTGNVALGVYAMAGNTTGGRVGAAQSILVGNVAVGVQSLFQNSSGSANTALGPTVMYSNTSASGNTAVGYDALYLNTTGGYAASFSNPNINWNNGPANTALGFKALYSNSTGNGNTGLGDQAGYAITGSNNLAVGTKAGGITTGSNNVIIGYNISVPDGTASNQLDIGNLIYSSGIDGTGTVLSSGSIGIGTTTANHKLDVNGNIGIAASGYLNFGATDGASGYGFYDNGGTLQYKNSGGSWTNLGGGSLPALTSANIWVGNGSNVATGVALSGDCAISNAGAITCTKTGGTSFSALATVSTVNLATQVSGGLGIANGGTNSTSQTTNGVNYYNGTNITSDSGFTYAGSGAVTITGAATPALSVTTTNTGNAIGVRAQVGGSGAHAVYGYALSGSGSSDAIHGQNDSTTGTAVYGGELATTGVAYGGYFTSGSSSGISLMSVAGDAGTKGLVVQGRTSQTANLAEFQNSSGTALTVVNSTGNVGIGTATPLTVLHVKQGASGATPWANSSTETTVGTFEGGGNSYISILTPNANQSGVLFGNVASNLAGGIIYNGSATANGLQFRVNGNNTQMVITSGGNVGIGTSTINDKLVVRTGTDRVFAIGDQIGISGAVSIEAYNDARSANIPLEIRATQITAQAFTGNGDNILITGNNNNAGIGLNNSGTGGVLWGIESTSNSASDGGGKLRFTYGGVTGTDAMVMTSAGIGIGTASPGAVLHVYTGSATTALRLQQLNGSSDAIEILNNAYSTNLANATTILQGSGGTTYICSSNQGVTCVTLAASGTSWGSASDVRMKKNIRTLSVLDQLAGYRAVSFDWKRNGKHDIGVIAQELYKVFPEVVTKGSDDPNANITARDEGAWSVSYDKLGALALEAVKELKADNDNLAAEHAADAKAIDELRREVTELKRQGRAQ